MSGLSFHSWRTPRILFLFILLAFLGTFGYNFTVLIPLVAEFVLNAGPQQFGTLTSALGLGALMAALALAALGKLSVRNLLFAAWAFVGLLVAVALSTSFATTCALLVGLGIVSVLFSTTVNTTLQLTVPDELRGRVMSIFFLLFAARYTKVGPNEVLIVSGINQKVVDSTGRERTVGFRIKKGGGTFVWPVFEKAEILSLELMTIDVKTPSMRKPMNRPATTLPRFLPAGVKCLARPLSAKN